MMGGWVRFCHPLRTVQLLGLAAADRAVLRGKKQGVEGTLMIGQSDAAEAAKECGFAYGWRGRFQATPIHVQSQTKDD